MRERESLDIYDRKPKEMVNYLRYNGYHFTKNMCEFAVSKMRKMNAATGKEERIEPRTKEQVDEVLTKNGVRIANNSLYDYIYVYHMAIADFYKSSIPDEPHLCLFVKDYVDDVDQKDGFIFNRWYADTVRDGIPIPWDDML